MFFEAEEIELRKNDRVRKPKKQSKNQFQKKKRNTFSNKKQKFFADRQLKNFNMGYEE